MRCAVGIDLGSTTTKAVVLGEDGGVLGRGITNTRSNYEIACRVALGEALVSARFGLVERSLAEEGWDEGRRRPALAALERGLRRRRHADQLEALARAAHAAAGPGSPHAHALDAVLAGMRTEAPALFAPGAARKSEFFRDLAAASFLRLAEQVARAGGSPFEALAALFDKAILQVENAPAEEGRFEALAAAALDGMDGPGDALRRAVAAAAEAPLEEATSVGTGYGRQRLPFPKDRIRSEILCHGLGAHAMFPGTRTVLDIGGQDTKAIQVDGEGIVTSFQMNDRCAAGCGRYLGYIADEMSLGLHELAPLAGAATRPVRISSTCTVFAGAELRERLTLGEKREDILAGLHRAIILRAMSLLARSGGVSDQLTFTGGVARNAAAVEVLRRLVAESYGPVTMNVSADSIYTGALGAALFALRGAREAAPAAAGA